MLIERNGAIVLHIQKNKNKIYFTTNVSTINCFYTTFSMFLIKGMLILKPHLYELFVNLKYKSIIKKTQSCLCHQLLLSVN